MKKRIISIILILTFIFSVPNMQYQKVKANPLLAVTTTLGTIVSSPAVTTIAIALATAGVIGYSGYMTYKIVKHYINRYQAYNKVNNDNYILDDEEKQKINQLKSEFSNTTVNIQEQETLYSNSTYMKDSTVVHTIPIIITENGEYQIKIDMKCTSMAGIEYNDNILIYPISTSNSYLTYIPIHANPKEQNYSYTINAIKNNNQIVLNGRAYNLNSDNKFNILIKTNSAPGELNFNLYTKYLIEKKMYKDIDYITDNNKTIDNVSNGTYTISATKVQDISDYEQWKSIVSTGTSVLSDVNSQTGTQTGTQVIDLTIPTEFPTIDFQPILDIGNNFTNKFPFSIPFDLYNIYRSFEVAKLNDDELKFEYTLDGKNKYYVDLSSYSNLFRLSRLFSKIAFIIVLILISKRLIVGGGE